MRLKYLFSKKENNNTGFTLIEVMVVASILVIISSMILANYPDFNERLAVRRAAEEIAASIRQAQAYGLAVKESSPGSGIFPSYGIYFDKSAPASYIIFADINANIRYDNPPDQMIKTINIQPPIAIDDLCRSQKQSPPGVCGLQSLTAVYMRPATTNWLKSSDQLSRLQPDIEIIIKSPKGLKKTIIIRRLSGQISIE